MTKNFSDMTSEEKQKCVDTYIDACAAYQIKQNMETGGPNFIFHFTKDLIPTKFILEADGKITREKYVEVTTGDITFRIPEKYKNEKPVIKDKEEPK